MNGYIDGTVPFAFNIKEMKPACVNLQAIYGGTPRLVMLFHNDCWQLYPSDDIKIYPLNHTQLVSLIKRCEQIHCKERVDKKLATS